MTRVSRALLILLLLLPLLAAGCASPDAAPGPVPPAEREQPSSPGKPQEPDSPAKPAPQEPDRPAEPAEPADDPAAKLLSRMTLDEKLGAMIIAGVEGMKPDARARRMIAERHVGGVIFYKDNMSDPAGVAAYTNRLKAWNRGNPSPLLVSVDEEGGKVSRLPGGVKLPDASVVGRSGDGVYAAKIGAYLGALCRAMGFNVDYAPVLDIHSHPDNPVIGPRAYGTDAETVTAMGLGVMNGIKGKGVIPVTKHFPGHGDTAVDSHLDLPVVNKTAEELQAFEWVPFQAAIRAGADVVMIAHILFPELDSAYPASLSRAVVTDVLRGQMGYTGVVVTDDLTMGAIAKRYGMGEAAVLSVQAGSDLLLVAHGYGNVDDVLDALGDAVADGVITEQRIDESVARILALKRKYKLTDAPVPEKPELSAVNASIRRTLEAHR